MNNNFLQMGQTVACGHCEPKKYAVYDSVECLCKCHTTTPEWEEEFREYFDRTLKPKKATIKNLDREICINFIAKQIQAAEERGYAEGKATCVKDFCNKEEGIKQGRLDVLASLEAELPAEKKEEFANDESEYAAACENNTYRTAVLKIIGNLKNG